MENCLVVKVLKIIFELNYKNLIICFSCIIILSILVSLINIILSIIVFFFLLLLKKDKNTEDFSKLKNIFNFFRFILFLIVISSFIPYLFFEKSDFFPFIISNYKLFLILCIIKSIFVILYMYWSIRWVESEILEEEYKEKEKAKLERLKYLQEQEKTRAEKRRKKR